MIGAVADAIRREAEMRAWPISSLVVRHLAVVAIAAMRKPTEAMTDAGDDVAGTLAITHDCSARLTWETMIDAALTGDGK
jgi:hypothetical protein